MRKLGTAQISVLRWVDRYPGTTKGAMASSDWRVIDRLGDLGLLEERFISGLGPTWFVTDAGHAVLRSHQ